MSNPARRERFFPVYIPAARGGKTSSSVRRNQPPACNGVGTEGELEAEKRRGREAQPTGGLVELQVFDGVLGEVARHHEGRVEGRAGDDDGGGDGGPPPLPVGAIHEIGQLPAAAGHEGAAGREAKGRAEGERGGLGAGGGGCAGEGDAEEEEGEVRQAAGAVKTAPGRRHVATRPRSDARRPATRRDLPVRCRWRAPRYVASAQEATGGLGTLSRRRGWSRYIRTSLIPQRCRRRSQVC